MSRHLEPDQLLAVQLGMCYRRLNILARRIALAQGRGDLPRPADVSEVQGLREEIARLKAGGDARGLA